MLKGQAKPAAKQPIAKLVDALERGDAVEVYNTIQDSMATGGLRAATVEQFVERAIANKDVRRNVRQSLVSERSWKRRMGEQPLLSKAEASRLADVAHVVRQARRLWQGNIEAAEKFLTTPHPRLHGRKPMQVAASEGGLPAVLELLQRIEEGAPV